VPQESSTVGCARSMTPESLSNHGDYVLQRIFKLFWRTCSETINVEDRRLHITIYGIRYQQVNDRATIRMPLDMGDILLNPASISISYATPISSRKWRGEAPQWVRTA